MAFVGIDLGTTYSLVAHLTSAGPVILPNALGAVLTPSVVGFDRDSSLLVGEAAKELQVIEPDRAVGVFKRHMGSDWKVKLGDRDFSAEQLSSLVLRSLKQDAEAQLGEPVTRAVITVPAYFNDAQRKATIRAGQLAGLVVERIINEPTAAALAYGFHETHESKLILICDLGGGTFDASLVDFYDSTLEVRASSGESILGGEDFTRTLAARILEARGHIFERIELESPLLVARLLQQSELAKRRLTTTPTAEIRVPDKEGIINEDSDRVTVTRDEFDTWTRNLLGRIEWPIRRVLGDAKVKPHQIDEVILVGGATRMPAVSQMLERMFEKAPRQRLSPDEVVALGAAVQAGLIDNDAAVADLVATDVCPFTLGTEVSHEFGGELRDGYFLPIIHRNTTIPVSRVKTVTTAAANQTEVRVEIFQGESRRVAENQLLGEFRVTGIAPAPAGQQRIQIRFTYDLNGVLEAEATIVETGRTFTHLTTKHASNLSPAELEAAVQNMQKLKSHAREDATNRYLLLRAERLYREAEQTVRKPLGDLLDGFEEVLESQDKQAIARYAIALNEFLDLHEPGMFGTGDGPHNDE